MIDISRQTFFRSDISLCLAWLLETVWATVCNVVVVGKICNAFCTHAHTHRETQKTKFSKSNYCVAAFVNVG